MTATRIHLDGECTMSVFVDPERDTQATIRIDRPDDSAYDLVLNEHAVHKLTWTLALANDKMERAHCLNWTADIVCPDELWDFVRTFLPAEPVHSGKRRRTRDTFAAIMYVLVNECRWRELPKRFDITFPMARTRFYEWRALDLWEKVYYETYMYGDTGLSKWAVNLCQKAHYATRSRPRFDAMAKLKQRPDADMGEHAWAAMFSPLGGRHALLRSSEPT